MLTLKIPEEGGRVILGWLRDFLEIYTWWEFWLVVSIPSLVVGVMLLFAYMLSIQNDILRTASVWSLILILTLGAATVDAQRKSPNK